MNVALIVAVVVVLGFYSKPGNKQSYHIAIMAIFGLAYFCLWRFFSFYLDVAGVDASDKNSAFILFVLAIGIIAVLPWIKNIQHNVAVLLGVLFFVCVVPAFLFEKQIKDIVAIWAGYFDGQRAEFTQRKEMKSSHDFNFSDGGIVIRIPSSWQQKTHNSGMSYFVRAEDDKTIAELRPSCFHNTDLSIPEIVNNIIDWDKSQDMEVKKQCFLAGDGKFNCFVKSEGERTNKIKEKWRWLIMDRYQRQNVELDVIFFSDVPQARQEAQAIINSVKWVPLDGDLPLCIGTTDWF